MNATTTTTVEPSSNNLSGEENPENKNPDITDPTDKPENPSDNESVIEKKNKRMSNNNQQVRIYNSLSQLMLSAAYYYHFPNVITVIVIICDHFPKVPFTTHS